MRRQADEGLSSRGRADRPASAVKGADPTICKACQTAVRIQGPTHAQANAKDERLLRTFQPIVAQPPAPATGAAAWVSHFLTLLILFAWLAALAWVRPLSLPDEGRYVGVAWEMLWSGNWLVPTLDTLPYFHKPPLFYWGTAAALAAFGVNEWAARLVSLLAATGSAFAL